MWVLAGAASVSEENGRQPECLLAGMSQQILMRTRNRILYVFPSLILHGIHGKFTEWFYCHCFQKYILNPFLFSFFLYIFSMFIYLFNPTPRPGGGGGGPRERGRENPKQAPHGQLGA